GESSASISVDGQSVGSMGILSSGSVRAWELNLPVAVAELDLQKLVDLYPPRTDLTPLPAHPAIERDLSVIVAESKAWSELESLVHSSGVDLFETVSFVGTYRGEQIGAGAKSVTMRLRFRDPLRTLRHEEVDPQIESVVGLLKSEAGATLRAQ
ncbi:MAG: phenylalanine--tRNA ligase subunit beta, partial [Phycisphaerales bacterium]